jgi:serine/threonine-protein kinase
MSAEGMGGGGRGDAEDDSWTELEAVQPDLVEAVPVRHGMVLGGRYVIEKIIGRGGCGVVVRAHDRDLQAVVAIKILRADLAGQRVWAGRLAREVRLARQIQHPNVCRVFDFEQAEGRAFLVMELAEKGTVREEIRSGALVARPLAERIADARAVAGALEAIHAAGIVHRDLTPQNLLRMSDGRLVLSDFGLATDASESTSVHGGTVAYMAPEVLRGGKSSFASDLWSLGVVMHEIVFGAKPRWSAGPGSAMLPPALGRKLTREERAVFETCRACSAGEPGHRVASAGAAGRMLAEGRRWWALPPGAAWGRRPVVWAGVAVLVATGAVGGIWWPRARQESLAAAAAGDPSPLIVPTGEPADWTDVSTVLAEVPEKIRCTRLLPDQRTIRFLWGMPLRAEDIDIGTRKRVPSPVVPAAYAEGCPDLSPDGKQLVYPSHTADRRPYAFVSQSADGRDAVPVVPTAEPSMLSDPMWLSDGQAFSYEVDGRHVGVFSTAAKQMYVLPDTTRRPLVTIFQFAMADRVLVAAMSEDGESTLAGVRFPQMKTEIRFRIPEVAMGFAADGSHLYYATRGMSGVAAIVAVDLPRTNARKIGSIRHQALRYPLLIAAGLSFVSIRTISDLVLRDERGTMRGITSGKQIISAQPCGDGLIISRREGDTSIVERINRQGKTLNVLSSGPADSSGTCAPDGRTWYYSHVAVVDGHRGPAVSIRRCDSSGCRDLLAGGVAFPSVSPDGSRLAFLEFEQRGPVVKWISVDGGESHEVSETETACAVGWTSPRALWVSRRNGRGTVWKEVDTETRRETGRTAPGSRDCADGRPDPVSPVDPDVRIAVHQPSQLRLIGRTYLDQP